MGDKRTLKISRTFLTGYRSIPLIRLQGVWIRNLGFKEGEYIEIEEEPGLIIIKRLDYQGSND